MRLHFIVVSVVSAALVSGCAQSPEVKEAPKPVAVAAKTEPVSEERKPDSESIENLLPGADVEKLLWGKAESGLSEFKADEARDKAIEHRLRKAIKKAQQNKDIEKEVRADIELGKFLRHLKRIHDAEECFMNGAEAAKQLEPGNQLRVHALALAAEMELQLEHFEKSLKMFDEGMSLVKVPNDYLETPVRFELRRVWALHGLKKDEEARKLLAKAKAEAQKEGKRSADYHVALAQEAAFAMESDNKKAFAEYSQAFDKLPKPDADDAEFGNILMKVCGKICRKRGAMEEEEYFDEKSDYFGDIIKASRRAAQAKQSHA